MSRDSIITNYRQFILFNKLAYLTEEILALFSFFCNTAHFQVIQTHDTFLKWNNNYHIITSQNWKPKQHRNA
jgi:hypothetical protein